MNRKAVGISPMPGGKREMPSDDGGKDNGRILRSGNIASGPNASNTESKNLAEDDMTAAHCGESASAVQHITMRSRFEAGILHLFA